MIDLRGSVRSTCNLNSVGSAEVSISISIRWPGFPTRVACDIYFVQRFFRTANDIENELIAGSNWVTNIS